MGERPDDFNRLQGMSRCADLDDRPIAGSLASGLLRVRFTVRRTMIAVAIVAIALGLGVTVHRRRQRCLRLAEYHQRQAEAAFADAYKSVRYTMCGPPASERLLVESLTEMSGEDAGRALKQAFEQEHLSEWYREAANRPWTEFAFPTSEN